MLSSSTIPPGGSGAFPMASPGGSGAFGPGGVVAAGGTIVRDNPMELQMGLDTDQSGRVNQLMRGPLGVDIDNDGSIDLIIAPERMRAMVLEEANRVQAATAVSINSQPSPIVAPSRVLMPPMAAPNKATPSASSAPGFAAPQGHWPSYSPAPAARYSSASSAIQTTPPQQIQMGIQPQVMQAAPVAGTMVTEYEASRTIVEEHDGIREYVTTVPEVTKTTGMKWVEVPQMTVVKEVVPEIVQTVVERKEKIVEIPVYIDRPGPERVVEKIVEKPIYLESPSVEKIVEVPRIVEKIVEKIVEVPRVIEKPVERTVEVPRVVEKVVDRPVDRVIETFIEVPMERVIETQVFVERPAPQREIVQSAQEYQEYQAGAYYEEPPTNWYEYASHGMASERSLSYNPLASQYDIRLGMQGASGNFGSMGGGMSYEQFQSMNVQYGYESAAFPYHNPYPEVGAGFYDTRLEASNEPDPMSAFLEKFRW